MNSIKSFFCLAALTSILCSSCSSSNFLLTTTDVVYLNHKGGTGGYVSTNNNGNGMVSTQSSVSNVIRYIYLPKEVLEDLGIKNLDHFVATCNSFRFKKAKKILLLNQQVDSSAIYYLESVRYLMLSNNGECMNAINRCTVKDLEIDKILLQIDNELDHHIKRGGVKINYFLSKYQSLLDNYELSNEYTHLVEIRIKLLRYL